jgi:hypothetical protein
MEDVLTTEQLAERYHTTPAAVRDWRYKGTGPRFFRSGKRVFYRVASVLMWEKEQEDKQAASA